ncbi:4179_t:CDS:2 [Cetraspora pellucida]|uniref:4179_t:CDS:1 n=1 Tax=Cetraspora pellucida TaxID=1433469 RepID=A0ACA9L3Q2_9GLOM|nr:4179_t:CDS:2 [Cetraspora pellucida]
MLERSLEKSLQATLTKALSEMKQSLHIIGNKVEEDKFWPEEKMDRPRDQYEYNEWRRIGKELDEALLSKSLELVIRARELAYTQAYTLRVANKEGWDIAAALRDSVSEDPMEAALNEKLVFARQSARSKKRKVDYTSPVSSSKSYLAFSQPYLSLGAQNRQLFQKFPGEPSNGSLYHPLVLQQQIFVASPKLVEYAVSFE